MPTTPPRRSTADAGSRSPWTTPVRRLLLAALLALGLALLLADLGGTYAMFRDQATGDAGTVAIGTASLEASWNAGDDDAAAQNLLPGETAAQTLTVANSGDVPLELSTTASGLADGFEIRAIAEPCGTDRLPAPAAGSTAQPLTAGESAGTAVVLGAGESLEVCVETAATDDLQPGTAIDYALRIDGRQAA